jgi:hypothetical protein
MIEFVTTYLLPIGTGPALLLKLLLPFVIAFLACRLAFYLLWTKRGRGSAQFSYTLASMLSASILTAIYFSLIGIPLVNNTMRDTLFHIAISFAFFAPTLVIMPVLLVVYIRKSDRKNRTISGIRVFAGFVLCLILQYLWLAFIFSQGH